MRENERKEFRWRQIVERERDHQQIWRNLLHRELFSSPESHDRMTLDLPQVWVVTENDINGTPPTPNNNTAFVYPTPLLRRHPGRTASPSSMHLQGAFNLATNLTASYVFVLQSYADFEKHLLQKSLADSLWGAFKSSFVRYRDTHNDDGSKKVLEARHSPPNDAALNATSVDSGLARTNSFDSHSHDHGRAPELHRSPTSSFHELQHTDQKIKSAKKLLKSNTLLLNTWQPDGKNCHMQTMTFIDFEKEADGQERQGDAKVYWNSVSPPGKCNLPYRVYIYDLMK